MLHYEALRQLTHERRLQRTGEAEAQRLGLEARGRRQRRARRQALTAGLEKQLLPARHALER